MGLLLAVVVHAANIQSLPRATTRASGRRPILMAPYFDAGGGEIWMVTRSVTVRDAEGVFALITTDLPVEDPGQ